MPAIRVLAEHLNHRMRFLELAASRTPQSAAHIHDCPDGHKLGPQGPLRTMTGPGSLHQRAHRDIVLRLHAVEEADRSRHTHC